MTGDTHLWLCESIKHHWLHVHRIFTSDENLRCLSWGVMLDQLLGKMLSIKVLSTYKSSQEIMKETKNLWECASWSHDCHHLQTVIKPCDNSLLFSWSRGNSDCLHYLLNIFNFKKTQFSSRSKKKKNPPQELPTVWCSTHWCTLWTAEAHQ